MLRKLFFAAIAGLALSNAALASDGIITVLNYTTNPIDIRVFDANITPVVDMPLMVNDKVSGHWFSPSTSWLGSDTFDSIHVFYVDKTSGAMLHCGDIPGGDPIPWGKTAQRTYEIDECGQGSSTLKWHPI